MIKMPAMWSSEEVYYTEGDWRVTEFKYVGGSYMSIQHHCTAGRSGSHIPGWTGMYYNYNGLNEPCYVCNRVPPEGIQGIFLMMKWDN